MSGDLAQFQPLSKGAADQLWNLFAIGPTWDGDLLSKQARDELYKAGHIERGDGWQWLTRSGVYVALGMDMGRRKEREQRDRSIPS